MKTSIVKFLSITVVLCAATTANAAPPPKPPADCGIDADKDGWCVQDASRKDPADPAKSFHIGALDCNDADSAVHPGTSEKLGDGVDNDCNASTPDAVADYIPAFCGRRPTAQCVAVTEQEIVSCDANTAACVVNYTAGRFATSFGWYFLDKDCDGERELLDQADKDEHDEEVRKGKRCVAPSAARGTKAAPKAAPAAAPADPKVAERLGKVEEAAATHAEALKVVGERFDGVDSVLRETSDRLDGLDRDIEGLRQESRAADNGLGHDIETLRTDLSGVLNVATTANTNAVNAFNAAISTSDKGDLALGRGVSAGLDAGYLLKVQQAVALKGKGLRPDVAHGVLLRGYVGAELPAIALRGVVGVAPTFGDDRGLLLLGGAELLLKTSPDSHGGFVLGVGGFGHDSGSSIIDRKAGSRGAYAELGYEWSSDHESPLRTPVRLALIGGPEQVGTKGESNDGAFKAVGWAPFAGLTLTVGAGTGPSLLGDEARDVIVQSVDPAPRNLAR